MSDLPKISVIVPVYNSELYLKQCIDSILSQTFNDFEVILIDDGSTDGSSSLCDLYAGQDKRINVIHQKNQGQAAARNVGISAARSDWIAFIDSDDIVHPQYLELMYRGIKEYGVLLAICSTIENSSVPDTFHSVAVDVLYKMSIVDEEWHLGPAASDFIGMTVGGKMIKKDIVSEYPFSVGRIFEDNAVVRKWLFAAGKYILVNYPLYFYRINLNGSSKGSAGLKAVDDVIWARDEIIGFYKKIGYEKAYKKALTDRMIFAVNIYYKSKKSNQIYVKALRKRIISDLREHKGELDFNKRQKLYICEFKHPFIMWVYWKVKQKLSQDR